MISKEKQRSVSSIHHQELELSSSKIFLRGRNLRGRGMLVSSKVKLSLEREIEARALEIPNFGTAEAPLLGWTMECPRRVLASSLSQPTYPSSSTADALPQQSNQGWPCCWLQAVCHSGDETGTLVSKR